MTYDISYVGESFNVLFTGSSDSGRECNWFAALSELGREGEGGKGRGNIGILFKLKNCIMKKCGTMIYTYKYVWSYVVVALLEPIKVI